MFVELKWNVESTVKLKAVLTIHSYKLFFFCLEWKFTHESCTLRLLINQGFCPFISCNGKSPGWLPMSIQIRPELVWLNTVLCAIWDNFSSYCKRSRNVIRTECRRWSLLCRGFCCIDMCNVFICYNKHSFICIYILKIKNVILHPNLPITATSQQQPVSSASRWPLWEVRLYLR